MGKLKHSVYPPFHHLEKLISRRRPRQKFALSCSNSLIPEHLEKEREKGGGKERGEDGGDGQQEGRSEETPKAYNLALSRRLYESVYEV